MEDCVVHALKKYRCMLRVCLDNFGLVFRWEKLEVVLNGQLSLAAFGKADIRIERGEVGAGNRPEVAFRSFGGLRFRFYP